MKIPLLAALAVAALLGLPPAAGRAAEGRIKRFPETISPNGVYALAWGDKVGDSAEAAKLATIPYATLRTDLAELEGIQDYLVETRKGGKPPLAIPKVEYFSGAEGHEANHGLTFAWSPDSRGVLVIYESSEHFVAAAWVDTARRRVSDFGPLMEGDARRLARDQFGREAEAKRVAVYFTRVAVLQSGILTVDVSLTEPRTQTERGEEFCFRLKYWVVGDDDDASLELVGNRYVPEDERKDEPEFDADGLEAELGLVYAQALRKLTTEGPADALKKEQAQWLKQRKALPTKENRTGYTRHRVEELRIRAEEKAAGG